MTEEELAEIEARANKAQIEICALCIGTRQWTMSIPAEQSRDSDLILQAVVDDNKSLLAEVRQLQGENRQLAIDHENDVRGLTRAAIAQVKECKEKDVEIARLKADAARLDWLQEHECAANCWTGPDAPRPTTAWHITDDEELWIGRGATLRAAIDSAIADAEHAANAVSGRTNRENV